MAENVKVERVVRGIRGLPPFPDTIRRINDMVVNQQATMSQIAEEISKDPALAAQVLKLVNSGFYGFSRINTISHAVVLIGLNAIRSMLSASWAVHLIADSFPGLYDHSVACARTCTLLSRRLGVGQPEEMGVIGLLHDIGKMVLANHLSASHNAIRDLVRAKKMRVVEAEQASLGVTHADLGRWLLDKWNIPASTVVPIAQHHAWDVASPYAAQTAVLMLADIMVRAEGIGWPGDNRMPVWHPDVARTLQLEIGDLPALMNEMADQLQDLNRYAGDSAS